VRVIQWHIARRCPRFRGKSTVDSETSYEAEEMARLGQRGPGCLLGVIALSLGFTRQQTPRDCRLDNGRRGRVVSTMGAYVGGLRGSHRRHFGGHPHGRALDVGLLTHVPSRRTSPEPARARSFPRAIEVPLATTSGVSEPILTANLQQSACPSPELERGRDQLNVYALTDVQP
jgi:hypothetical protein